MPAYIKDTGGTWSSAISAFYIKSTTWRTISAGYIKVAGAWASFFTSTLTPSIASTVEISRNNATYPSTLTGTNYYWTNSTSLTYVFQKSSDNVNFTDIGSAAVINNPSSGSSNTVTYALTLPDFPAFTSYYRFVVTAVNSTYSTSATSTSTSVSVSRPAPINTVAPTISPSSGTVGVTQYSVTSNGTWDPVDADGVYQYLWQSYDTPSYISAPGTNTLSTYTPPSDFLTLGYQSPIRCRVTAANATNSTAAFSNTATVLGAALTPTFGANTSTAGGFTGSVTNYNASYTWGISTNSGSVSFGTPSGSTYPFTVTGLSSSASATVTVTTSRSGYNSGSAQTTGTATTQVPVNTVAPTIAPTSGTAGVTAYSVTSVGSWTNSPTGYAYLWQYQDQPGVFLTAPGSNTSSSYTPPSNFFALGYASPIRCRVIASNAGGNSSAAFSNTASVSAPVSIPSGGTVSISTNTGNYNVGSIITYSTSGWANTPTSYSLRLYNGTNPVLTSDPLRASTSSTSGTYTITSGDVPNYFKAFATASNSAGTSAEASSAQVGPAVAVTTVPGIVTSFTATSSLASTTLSWNATWSAPSSDGGAAITSYKVFVERGSSSSGPWSAATTSISTTAGGTYSGAYTAVSPYSTVNATTPKTIYGRVTSTTSTWIRVYVAAVNSVGTGSTTTAVG